MKMKVKIDGTIVNTELDLVMRDQHLQLVVEETIGERVCIVTYLGKEEAGALHAALGLLVNRQQEFSLELSATD